MSRKPLPPPIQPPPPEVIDEGGSWWVPLWMCAGFVVLVGLVIAWSKCGAP